MNKFPKGLRSPKGSTLTTDFDAPFPMFLYETFLFNKDTLFYQVEV